MRNVYVRSFSWLTVLGTMLKLIVHVSWRVVMLLVCFSTFIYCSAYCTRAMFTFHKTVRIPRILRRKMRFLILSKDATHVEDERQQFISADLPYLNTSPTEPVKRRFNTCPNASIKLPRSPFKVYRTWLDAARVGIDICPHTSTSEFFYCQYLHAVVGIY